MTKSRQISKAYEIAEKITDCQGCGFDEMDGKVLVEIDNDKYYVACPLLKKQCRYGQVLLSQLDSYALESIKALPGLPLRFHKRLEEPQRTEAVRRVNIWSHSINQKCFLVLHGEHGTGKSFGAAYALHMLARKKNYENWSKPHLWSKLSAMWCSAYQVTAKDDLFDSALKIPILIIDDLGNEGKMPRLKDKLNEIVSKRYDHMNLTIITTNEDELGIEKNYGRRMLERIIDVGDYAYCGRDNIRLSA